MYKVMAGMAGNVWKVLFKEGDSIEGGEDVIILESMKMEITVQAEKGGIIKQINVNEGDFVNEGDVLVEIE